MPVYHVELYWDCIACPNRNGGLHKECKNCGKPRTTEPDIYPEDMSSNAALTRPEDIRDATAGADWKCKYCGSQERRLDGECKVCTAPQNASNEQDQPRFEDSSPLPKVETDGNYRSQPKKKAYQHEQAYDYPKPDKPNKSKIVVLAVGAVTLLFIGLFFLFRTHIDKVKVSAVSWEHLVHVSRYSIYSHEGFAENEPGDAFDVHPVSEHIHHYEKVFDHTEHWTEEEKYGEDCAPPKCHTTAVRCSSNRNGTATCSGGDQVCNPGRCTPKYRTVSRSKDVYRDEPVYRSWYAWKVWEWAFNRTVRATGVTTETRWPGDDEIKLNQYLGNGEKERFVQVGTYHATLVETDGTTHSFEPRSEVEFKTFPLGSKHTAKISALTFELIR